MKIGVMYSGIQSANGADYVAEYIANAVHFLGHEVIMIGRHGGTSVKYPIEKGLDFIIHSSGFNLTPNIIKRLQNMCPVIMWTHNDEMISWQDKISKTTKLVNIHYSYTKKHAYGSHVKYLPLAADHTIYNKLSGIHNDKEYDICMIGAFRPWRKEFCDKIQKIFSKNFFHIEWNLNLETRTINTIYNSTKIVLAPIQDCDENIPANAWGCPCRTFEIPATGAFQLQVERGGVEPVYGPTVVTIRPEKNMDIAINMWATEINKWLLDDAGRKELAQKAYEHTLKKHLYIHRIETMLQDVSCLLENNNEKT